MDKKETAGMRPEARAGAVFLTGFMGCGKSTVGGCLSRLLSLPFTDTDARIEQEQKKTISEIFAQVGEEAFRGLETAALARIGAKEGRQVVSTGGGLPLRRENRSLMKEAGTVVFLRVRPETVYERLRGDTSRPLLWKEDPEAEIRRLLSERTPLYEEAADLILDADEKTPGELAAEIARWVLAGERKENDAMKILVINGPNLNFLGIRERAVYGTKDYEYLLSMLKKKAEETGCRIETFQSNHEGAIIDRIQEAYFDGTDGIVINPGAYTHYSYAIHDALASVQMPKVEIHISDITAREEFRKVSVTAPACDRQIFGHGLEGYLEAVDVILAGKSADGE